MSAPVLAVIGGGQLARMMTPAATALGITLRVLVESEQASAASAAHDIVVGLPSDPHAIDRLLAEPRPTAVTVEHEHIPAHVFERCAAAGVPIHPGAEALAHARDKVHMRSELTEYGLPMPAWAVAHTSEDVDAFLGANGGEAVAKTARGGYDGKGVRVIADAHDVDDWLAAAAEGGPEVLLEEKVPFTRELAALVARTPSGEIVAWPVVESIQIDGVCTEVIAPAPGVDQEAVQSIARAVAEDLGVVGVLAVELFETADGTLINELAMRPHNSGHWSIDGAVTSQFEQHLRAVLDLPLGDTAPTSAVTVMHNVLGGARAELTDALAEVADPGVKIHLYGKDVKPGRKVGHVNVSGVDVADTRRRAREAAAIVRDGGAA